MYYKLHYELTKEVIDKFTDVMLQMYDEHKDDDFFLKAIEEEKEKEKQ